MLDMSIYAGNAVRDNEVVINGLRVMVSDEVAKRILNIIATTTTTPAMPVATPVAAPVAPAPAPKSEWTRPTDVHEVNVAFEAKGNAVRFDVVEADGTRRFPSKAVRMVVNARIKAAGFVWDSNDATFGTIQKGERKGEARGAWVKTKAGKRDLAGTAAFVKAANTTVTAAELNAVYDGWEARKARKQG